MSALDDQGERIQFLGALQFRDRFFMAPFRAQQQIAVPMVSLGEIRIQFNRPVKLLLGALPIPIMQHLNRSQRSVRLGQRAVELQSFLSGRLGLGHVAQAISVKRKQRMAIREAGIGQREFGIFFDRLVEILDRLAKPFRFLWFQA